MNKRFLFLLTGLMSVMMLFAQEAPDQRPQRTPEEEALKQTMRLTRELGIKDSVRIDTIYRMHLKYARFRQKGLSRAENMERMQAIYAELKQMLTPEEFEQFMNHPAEQPRRPHGAKMVSNPDVVILRKPTETKQNQ
jgi:hypothetical protein